MEELDSIRRGSGFKFHPFLSTFDADWAGSQPLRRSGTRGRRRGRMRRSITFWRMRKQQQSDRSYGRMDRLAFRHISGLSENNYDRKMMRAESLIIEDNSIRTSTMLFGVFRVSWFVFLCCWLFLNLRTNRLFHQRTAWVTVSVHLVSRMCRHIQPYRRFHCDEINVRNWDFAYSHMPRAPLHSRRVLTLLTLFILKSIREDFVLSL